MNDLDLLRKYEPIVRYTAGEMFFPCAVDEFVNDAGLWLIDDKGDLQQLARPGELNLEKLAKYDEVPDNHVLYISVAGEPLDPIEYQRWLRRTDRDPFVAPGRLARVPLLSRIVDSLFDMSLMVRGTVPGGMSAAVDLKYKELLTKDSRRVYYGRVRREGGWIVLHYLFFFTMNNWRSGFFGVNDHESDWEQVFIYLADEGDAPEPRWAAFASHDFSGDDLRRRWDDPRMTREGDHPVIYAGAGSHASYFEQGEYVMDATPSFLIPVKNGTAQLRRFWVDNLGQGSESGAELEEQVGSLISIPFVDYARGDGKSIGPGQDEEWTPILIADDDGWVDKYRGLWGLDTRDPFGGERAPAGPKYNRDGSVRQAWYDPLGWAGIDKILPPQATLTQLEERLAAVAEEEQALEDELDIRREAVRKLALDVEALQSLAYHRTLYEQRYAMLQTAQSELQGLQARKVETTETLKALQAYRTRARGGDWGSPDAHLHHVHHPAPPPPAQSRAVEVWAAISGALALLLFVGLIIFRPENWIFWAVVIGIAFGAVESLTRGRIGNFLLTTVIVLALIAGVILIVEFWRWILVLGLIAVVFHMIRDNLSELVQSRH